MPNKSKSKFKSKSAKTGFEPIEDVIKKYGTSLASLPGVVEVWAGHKFKDGRLTDEPAVIVSVLEKKPESRMKKAELLPRELDDVPVDVVPASPIQMVRYALRHGRMLTEKSAPHLAGMVTAEALPGVAEAALTAVAPLTPYVPPAPPLKAVNENMRIVCHASPDAGWRLLAEFLGQTVDTLTSTMYEFTAAHIRTKLRESLASPRKFELIMDGGNDENETSRAELKQALKARMKFAWAAVSDSPQVTKSFFPTAYHIKVSVRDGNTIWLSSGNWKDSNQPQRDPIKNPFPTQAKKDAFHRKQNRDWHVVVQNSTLAGQFERFIRHDIKQAIPLQKRPGAAALATIPQEFLVAVEPADPGGVEFFSEELIEKKMRVMPILTPDNYADHVLPLIKGAKKKLYFQNQSLSTSIKQSPRYGELLKALKDKSNSPGVDVRIIVRGDYDPHKILSSLSAFGFNMDRVKLQNGNHNKGILIDDRVTVMGSHNWTGQGTTANRDATLIFHDPDVTRYYTELFLHDWTRRSSAKAPTVNMLAAVAGKRLPAGMMRLTAREILDGSPPDLF